MLGEPTLSRLAQAHCGRPRFHVWQFHGDRLLLDIRSNQLVFVSSTVFDILSGIESGSELREAAVVAASRHGDIAVNDALSALACLEAGAVEVEHGQFGVPFFTVEEIAPRDSFVEPLADHHPRAMMLMIAGDCNFRCSYCFQNTQGWLDRGAPSTRQRRMATSDIEAAIDDLIRRSGRRPHLTITFFGGEPFLNWEGLVHGVEYSARRGKEFSKTFDWTVTTNMSLLTDEMIDFLVRHKFGVMASIDGDRDAHDRHRTFAGSGKGSYDTVASNIDRLLTAQHAAIEAGVQGVRPLKIRPTLTAENDDLRAVEHFIATRFPGARVSIGSTYESANGASDAPDETERKRRQDGLDLGEDLRVVRLHEEARDKGGWKVTHQYDKALQGVWNKVRTRELPTTSYHQICGVGRNVRATDPDGNIWPCHRYPGMDAFRMGTVESTEEELREASSTYYDKVAESYDTHCGPCWARFLCGGTCPWSLSQDDGSVTGPPLSYCDAVRSGNERTLWLYMVLWRDAPEFLERLIRQPVLPRDDCTTDPIE